jgi:NTP pyrophosphatase (non-canonical NTP hydrolase)
VSFLGNLLPPEEQLQRAVGRWHRERFPDALMEHVALKTAEEAGEVAKAVNGVVAVNASTPATTEQIAQEAADVVITLMVLLDRWTDHDLLTHVSDKLAILQDPSSGHPASLR